MDPKEVDRIMQHVTAGVRAEAEDEDEEQEARPPTSAVTTPSPVA